MLITGGGSGIGRTAALLFAEEGAEVVVVGRNREKLEETVDLVCDLGGKCTAVRGDISNRNNVERIVTKAVNEMEGIDVLFNNAGIYRYGSVENMEEELWDDIFAVNLKGVYLMSRYVIGEMKRNGGGVIVNNSSTLGMKPVPGTSAYSAAKAGVISLTKSMALEHAKDGIRVNCICPGVVETPIHEGVHGKSAAEFIEEMAPYHPLGRVGTPEDIAYAALFLASDEAGWITGAIIPVDGGISIA